MVLGPPGGFWDPFPPILVPISLRGHELWPKLLLGEFLFTGYGMMDKYEKVLEQFWENARTYTNILGACRRMEGIHMNM